MSVAIGEKRHGVNGAGNEGGEDGAKVTSDAQCGEGEGKGGGGIWDKIVESARRIGEEVVSMAEIAVERKRGEVMGDKDRISLCVLHRAEVDLREVMVEQEAQLVCSAAVRERAQTAWGTLRKMVKDMSKDRCCLRFRV